jgi:hypothetical protein
LDCKVTLFITNHFYLTFLSKNFKRMKTKFNFLIFLFIASLALLGSCQYKFIVEPVTPPPNPEDTISFTKQIEPIFTANNCIACHDGKQQNPDLRTGNAYNSIISMGLVDTNDPESSILYVHPSPDGNHYVKLSAGQAALVLQWIQQGAKNN